ncbi:MAG: LamG domain-containing protein, partial [Planctomycetes bacterium]|nr:LamG domain-containing protein [Planctomycetota bacterium]
LYKNGTVVAEITDKKISFGTYPTMFISGFWADYVANGIIDELRISNKVRYGKNFTPPTR